MTVYIPGHEPIETNCVDIVWTDQVLPKQKRPELIPCNGEVSVQLEMKATDEWVSRMVYIPADDEGNDDDWPLGHRAHIETVQKMIQDTIDA